MSKKTLNLYQAITAHGKAETKATGLMALVVDGAIADKVKVEYWKRPAKDSKGAEPGHPHAEHFAKVNDAILAAFPAAWQRTYNAANKTLADGNEPGQKGDAKYPAPGTRRYVQQQIASRRSAFERAHKARVEGPNKKGADQKRTDDRTFCEERLVAIIKRCEKAEDATFDVVSVLETCRVALSKVQAKF